MSSEKIKKIWLNGRLVLAHEAKVNVLTPTCQFGANVFEGVRCYWNDEDQQLYAFKLKDHLKRLQNSIKLMRFEIGFAEEQIEAAFMEAVKANSYQEDIEVRINVFLDGSGSWYSSGPTGMFIAPGPKGRLYEKEKGVHCCVSSWERINDRSLSPRVKMGATYMNSRLAQLEAVQNGYDTAIFLNDLGKVSEAPGSCIFIMRNGALLTPPLTASILESITRAALMELAENELKLKVIERDIDRTELYIADESFLCGTAMEIVSILSVDRFELNQGKPGLITEKLRQIFFDIARGKNKRYLDWLTPIYN